MQASAGSFPNGPHAMRSNPSLRCVVTWMPLFRERLGTAAEAVQIVASGQTVYVGSGCAAPHELIGALTDRAEDKVIGVRA